MHVNIYSNEGGVKDTQAGKKLAKDGVVYPYIDISFENGNALAVFGKTVAEVEAVVAKINEAMDSLKMLDKLDKAQAQGMIGARSS